ncbi:uncharacterized protein [Physcomitrium patens]|uniref:uncharacterized protein isoform X2 n=1 Tax=Physcomitrium patens TaxID=3218 RepID=UPI003CCDCB45
MKLTAMVEFRNWRALALFARDGVRIAPSVGTHIAHCVGATRLLAFRSRSSHFREEVKVTGECWLLVGCVLAGHGEGGRITTFSPLLFLLLLCALSCRELRMVVCLHGGGPSDIRKLSSVAEY